MGVTCGMGFVPTLCTACNRVQLVSLIDATHGGLGCGVCGAEVRVVPACTYPEHDRQAFADMSEIVAESAIGASEALLLSEQVTQSLASGDYSRTLEQLCERMPRLLPLQQAVGQNAVAQRRPLALLKTILGALATARPLSAGIDAPCGSSPKSHSRIATKTETPGREAFFASRSGVCVYVSVGGYSVRVCFSAPDAEGRVEGEVPPRSAEDALTKATEAFAACGDGLAPLFEQIAEASSVGN